MKVYQLSGANPVGTKHKEFASLSSKRSDRKLLDSQKGRGLPFTMWRKVQLFVYNPGDPRPDFFRFGLEYVCNQRVCELVGSILEESGQLLPLTIEGETGFHCLYNCTTVLDVLDPDGSIWEFHKESGTSKIVVPSFHANRFGKAQLFKYPRSGLVRLYVVERTGDYRDGGFKALVERYGLAGLRFDLLWTDKDGPDQPRFLYNNDDPLEYRTADGRPWMFRKANSARAKSVASVKAAKNTGRQKRKRV
jgi:hypothetical protein